MGNELYVVNDGGILTCVDALTGELHWRERLDGEFSSSPTYAGGLLYFSDQAGVTTVIKPSKTFQVVSKNELDGTAHMASFAPLENPSSCARTRLSIGSDPSDKEENKTFSSRRLSKQTLQTKNFSLT